MLEKRLLHSLVFMLVASLGAGSTLVSCYVDYDDDDECDFDDDENFDDDDDFDDDDECIVIITRTALDGEAVVLLTDRPDGRVQSFLVNVERVVLAGPSVEPQILFDSAAGHAVDLLTLREQDGERRFELLVTPTAIPPGAYDRVHLALSDPVLVLASGEVARGEQIDVAGAGEIEVGLGKPVAIGPGERLHLQIDIDVARSLSETDGATRPWRFRPLALIDMVREESRLELQTIAPLAGTVSAIEDDLTALRLELPDGRGAVEILLDPRTSIVDARGANRSVAEIAPGTAVVVEGRLESGEEVAATRVRLARYGDAARVPDAPHITTLPEVDSERLGAAEPVGDRATGFSVPAAWQVGEAPEPIRGAVVAVDPRSRTVRIRADRDNRVLDLPASARLVHVTERETGLLEDVILLESVEPGMLVEAHRDAAGIVVVVFSGSAATDPQSP